MKINRRALWIIIGILWVGVLALGLNVWRHQPHGSKPVATWTPKPATPTPTPNNRAISLAELASYDGRDGRLCYAAVNEKVYLIPTSSQWQNGQHLPSNGLVYCGQDLTAQLSQSPHGATVLKNLEQVGVLVRP